MGHIEGPAYYTKLALQGAFVLAVSALAFNYLGTRLIKYLSKWFDSDDENSKTESTESLERYKQEKNIILGELQKKHQEKAKDYNERILIPRNEEKLKKKLEYLDRFSGPAWKGAGHASGYIQDLSGNGETTHESTAHRRTLIQNISEDASNVVERQTKDLKRKQNIVVPEEPSEDCDNSVTIVFRTPLGTSCQRRFLSDNTIQNLLDFITTKGFSQRMYTLATSYPRTVLEDPNLKITDLNSGRRFLLNIEDKE